SGDWLPPRCFVCFVDFVGWLFRIRFVRQGGKLHLANRTGNPASQFVLGNVDRLVTTWASDDRHAGNPWHTRARGLLQNSISGYSPGGFLKAGARLFLEEMPRECGFRICPPPSEWTGRALGQRDSRGIGGSICVGVNIGRSREQ